MLKSGSFFLSLLIIVGLCQSAEAQDSLTLTGRVTDVKLLEENPQSIAFEIQLELTLRNQSSATAIFYRDELSVLGPELFTQTKDGQAELLHEQFTPSSTDRSPVWNDLRRRLNVPTPPSNLTLTLAGGQSLELNRKVVVRFYKNKYSLATWQEIRTRSPLFLRITLEVFPNNLDTDSKPGNTFGETLQTKWRRFGQLVVEPVRSEPIPIKFPGILDDRRLLLEL
jgi:hypothetical protein